MKRTYCDICETEIKEPDPYLVVFGRDYVGQEPDKFELCEKCAYELKKFLKIKERW